VGTLSSELGAHAGRIAGQPRVYVDANVPAGLVAFMRTDLHWDVLFVIEHEDLRRERDGEHFRLARELRRTLITLDRDYLDDRSFPMEQSGGVLVLTAPGEKEYRALLTRLDAAFFRDERPARLDRPEQSDRVLPLCKRKLHVHVDWQGETARL
jgi:predicted nuclease of predicted toxin-antitoxin system